MKFRFGNKRKGSVNTFGDILPDVLKEFKIDKAFTIEDVKNNWVAIVGDTIATHSIPDRIFKKTLFIAVDHSTYAHELSMMSRKIIDIMNNEFMGINIAYVKFEVKQLRWK